MATQLRQPHKAAVFGQWVLVLSYFCTDVQVCIQRARVSFGRESKKWWVF